MAKKRISFVLALQTGQFNTALTMAQKKLMRVSGQMKRIGSSMSRNITMPFVAIGAAGAKMTIDFDKNMTKIQTLVGATASEVNAFRKDVLKLSGQTAQAPADLADGLFFLTSAGLKGANAMETLEAVSKGVAIGLGEQTDLAKVAAAAQNAYGADVLSASEALDIFGGMVKTGMFEASDLASVLGTQLGLASNLGISFEELGAMISTYTKTTGDANSATTGLSGIMMSFAKITPKQEKALASVGMTVEGLREKLGSQGLQATLIEMQTAFENNNVDLSEFFSKSQALKGVLGVLGNQTETYKDVLDDLSQSTGFVEDGFNTVSQTAGFKLEKSFNKLKLAAAEIGAKLLPIAIKAAEFVAKLVDGFMGMDDSTKSLVVGLTALAAGIGPLLSLGGTLAGIFAAIAGPVGIAVAAIVGGAVLVVKNWDVVKKALVDVINYFIDLYNESIGFRMIVETIAFVFKQAFANIKFFVMAGIALIKGFVSNFTSLFGGIGDIIKGVFTLDIDTLAKGLSDAKDALADTFNPANNEDLAKATQELGETTAANFKTGFDNIKGKNPIEPITEADIDAVVDKAGEMVNKVKNKLTGLFSGGGGATDNGGGTGGGGTGGGGTTGGDGGTTDPSTDGIESFADKYVKTMDAITEYTDVAFQRIGEIMSQHFANKAMELDNEFAREKERIDQSQMSEEDKAKKTAALEEKIAKKKKLLQLKQAKAEKTMAIFQAVVGVATAVAQNIGNPILAGIIAALGAVQIATIASTPLPALAEGGLAYGPTTAIVGDNLGAKSDPEVIAPLSKLSGIMQGAGAQKIIVEGEIRGEDIYLINKRQEIIQGR
jgi:TP901 family phage tail tape measure protein